MTIFGESAGGESVAYLLASPRARGLFAKAILQSPNMSNKLLVAGVAIAAAASSAHAVETHPFVEPVVTGDVAFLATFSDGLGSWSGSKNDKYNGACARSER